MWRACIITLCILVVLTTYEVVRGRGAAGITPEMTQDELITACNVMAKAASDSQNFGEALTYKKAYDYLVQKVQNKQSVQDSDRFFRDLSQANHSIDRVYCFSLDVAAKPGKFNNREVDQFFKLWDEGVTVSDLETAIKVQKGEIFSQGNIENIKKINRSTRSQ